MTGTLSLTGGQGMTVDKLVGNPLYIPQRVIDILRNGFIEEAILRDAGSSNGLVQFDRSTPLYLDDEIAELAEFAEIPIGAGRRGVPMIAMSTKKGLGIRVSEDMKRKNKLDDINRQITQLTNTFVRGRALALRRLLLDPAIPTLPAPIAWDQPGGRPRRDIALAQEIVGSAVPDQSQEDDVLGFEADTVAMSSSLAPILMDNDNFVAVYKDALSADDIRYTGKMPKEIMGLAGLTSRSWPADRVLVVERKTVGFYSDARALEATGLYPEGGGPNGGPRESWRTDTTMERVIGLDQPLAACWITGVKSA